jgi:predicted MFS family arabinose efflux permease
MQRGPSPPYRASAVPRMTLVVIGGFALFFVLAMLYSMPVILAQPPAGAAPDYIQEQVRAHLHGKVSWILLASFLIAGGLGARWMKR